MEFLRKSKCPQSAPLPRGGSSGRSESDPPLATGISCWTSSKIDPENIPCTPFRGDLCSLQAWLIAIYSYEVILPALMPVGRPPALSNYTFQTIMSQGALAVFRRRSAGPWRVSHRRRLRWCRSGTITGLVSTVTACRWSGTDAWTSAVDFDVK